MTPDVLILGGGPAGTAAGLTLLKRDDLSVAILERTQYAAHRVGESLTPGIRPLLEYLGVWDAFREEQSLEAFGSRASWGQEAMHALDYLFTPHGSGWTLDRVAFDRLLADAFHERGGRLYTNTRFLRCERTADGGWQVPVEDGPPIRCRYLIDATGRTGQLARHLGVPRVMHDRLVGIGRVGRLPEGAEVEGAVQVEACEIGWWYTAPIPGRRMVVTLMTDADLAVRHRAVRTGTWEALLRGTTWTRRRTDGIAFEASPRGWASHSSMLRRAGGEGWVAVGDAVAAHDPLSSSGIPHAIGTGVQGALTAADALFGDGQMLPAYDETIRRDVAQYRCTHWQYYQREARWPDAPFWARRRTPVRLPAAAVIESVHPLGDNHEPLHLTARQSEVLHAHCRPGRPVHTIVHTFAAAHPSLPDERIILGMQELVEVGSVGIE